MGWRKHFKIANVGGAVSPIHGSDSRNNFGFRNFQSQLPEVYVGHPNRIERYNSYEQMDADSEINAALDILAEFCTQTNEGNGTPFDIEFKSDPSDNEIKIIKDQLQKWCKLNEFDRRIFKLLRNTMKYGDQLFIRDPETFELMWVEMSKVIKVIVNESAGKEPEQYVIRDLNPNFQNLTVTAVTTSDTYHNNPNTIQSGGAYTPNAGVGMGGGQTGSRFTNAQNDAVINAEHVVHLSLTEGLDMFWPFGVSVLETVFKTYKQKELLEDAIIIYRIQRAPERRLFKIDVGEMPPHMAMAFVERVKNEVHQRRIPTQNGGGRSMMDATYNPISTNEDFFFPQTPDGRGSSVEVLPGGSNLGEITDLRFFTNKLFRGLRIPASYLPTQTDEAQNGFSDGKVGIAQIQEWRFNQYCKRLQALIAKNLDREFKLFLRFRGISIDNGMFDIKFTEPQNFSIHRQADIDQVRLANFGSVEQLPYMSKRFAMERFLGLTPEEIQRNEELWSEEQKTPAEVPADARAAGITPGGISSDMEAIGPMGDDMGAEGGEPMGDAAAAPGMATPGPAPAGPMGNGPE